MLIDDELHQIVVTRQHNRACRVNHGIHLDLGGWWRRITRVKLSTHAHSELVADINGALVEPSGCVITREFTDRRLRECGAYNVKG